MRILKRGRTRIESIDRMAEGQCDSSVFFHGNTGGINEWNEYPVPREKLVELLEICERAHNSEWMEAEEILPTMPGLYFGSLDYDDYYHLELSNTIARLIGC